MDGISVEAEVRGETVTFVEPSFKDSLKIIASLRAIFKEFDFNQIDRTNGTAFLFDLLENEDTFRIIVTTLASMCDKDVSFFEEMKLSDASAIYEAFRSPEFEKVVRRFFTKATGAQQIQRG